MKFSKSLNRFLKLSIKTIHYSLIKTLTYIQDSYSKIKNVFQYCSKNQSILSIVSLLVVFLMWASWAKWGPIIPISLMRPFNENVTIGDAGSWGESFSALNTLFSGFAMVGLLITINMQRIAIKKQEIDYHRQMFDKTFYELLNLQREVKKELVFKYSNIYKSHYSKRITKDIIGPSAFDEAYRDLTFVFMLGSKIINPNDRNEIYNKLNLYFYNRNDGNFSMYFRITHNIIRKIKDDNILNNNEKKEYTNLLRSQMSEKEACIVGLNGLSPESKRLSELITYARLLRYTPKRGPIKNILEHQYPEETFRARTE